MWDKKSIFYNEMYELWKISFDRDSQEYRNGQLLAEPIDNEKEKNKIIKNEWVYIIVIIVLCLVITCVPYFFTQCWILGCA